VIWTVKFRNDGREFSGFDAALAFMLDAGFSVGPIQRGAPVGAMYGQYIVGKWRNLSTEQKDKCHATLQAVGGSYRDGDVICTIKRDTAPEDAIVAFDRAAHRLTLTPDQPLPRDSGSGKENTSADGDEYE
jgi:hypothetical protein